MFIAVTSALISQIAQAKLSATAISVYLYLRSLNPFGNRTIKTTQSEIAATLGISQGAVSKALKKLKSSEFAEGLDQIVITPRRYSEFNFASPNTPNPDGTPTNPNGNDSIPDVDWANPNGIIHDLKPAHSKAFETRTNILDLNRSKKEDLTHETSFFSEEGSEIEPEEFDIDDLPYIQPEPVVETQTVETAPAKIPSEDFVHPINRFEQQFQRYPWQIPGGQWDDLDPGFVEFRRKALQATPAYKNRDCTTADAIVSILRLQTARVGQSQQELATNLATLKQYWNLYQAKSQGKPQQASGFESLPESVHQARIAELEHLNIFEFDAKYSFDYRQFLIKGGYFDAVA